MRYFRDISTYIHNKTCITLKIEMLTLKKRVPRKLNNPHTNHWLKTPIWQWKANASRFGHNPWPSLQLQHNKDFNGTNPATSENLLVLVFPQFPYHCYPHIPHTWFTLFVTLLILKLKKWFFWLPMTRRSHPCSLKALSPHKPDNFTRTKEVRRSFLLLPAPRTGCRYWWSILSPSLPDLL